jgi:TonB-dependent SusC/RagA subfamily outer membrane receptor
MGLKFDLKKHFSVLMILLGVQFAFGQTIQTKITGKVLDDTGNPVIGATVSIPDLKAGSITDIDGNYELSLNAAEGSYRVEVSYIGYKTEVLSVDITSASTQKVLDFTIREDFLKLDEVVVIGNSVQASRRALGNSITTIGAKDIENAGTGNAISALQGKVAGARITQVSGDPSGAMSINLRGVNSITGSSDPLYVIDGVIVSNSSTPVTQIGNSAGESQVGTPRLADINPNDIESINIINGPAAAAQYGSRAAAGVVLITTKKGTVGKPRISVGTSFNVNQLRKKCIYLHIQSSLDLLHSD